MRCSKILCTVEDEIKNKIKNFMNVENQELCKALQETLHNPRKWEDERMF